VINAVIVTGETIIDVAEAAAFPFCIYALNSSCVVLLQERRNQTIETEIPNIVTVLF
jgi:hypothetical protein